MPRNNWLNTLNPMSLHPAPPRWTWTTLPHTANYIIIFTLPAQLDVMYCQTAWKCTAPLYGGFLLKRVLSLHDVHWVDILFVWMEHGDWLTDISSQGWWADVVPTGTACVGCLLYAGSEASAGREIEMDISTFYQIQALMLSLALSPPAHPGLRADFPVPCSLSLSLLGYLSLQSKLDKQRLAVELSD